MKRLAFVLAAALFALTACTPAAETATAAEPATTPETTTEPTSKPAAAETAFRLGSPSIYNGQILCELGGAASGKFPFLLFNGQKSAVC